MNIPLKEETVVLDNTNGELETFHDEGKQTLKKLPYNTTVEQLQWLIDYSHLNNELEPTTIKVSKDILLRLPCLNKQVVFCSGMLIKLDFNAGEIVRYGNFKFIVTE